MIKNKTISNLVFIIIILIFNIKNYKFKIIVNIILWGLGIGDWGLGIGDWAQSPIPNPQSPNPQSPKLIFSSYYIPYLTTKLYLFIIKKVIKTFSLT